VCNAGSDIAPDGAVFGREREDDVRDLGRDRVWDWGASMGLGLLVAGELLGSGEAARRANPPPVARSVMWRVT